VDRSELIAVLEESGLSPYQADAYVTLLRFGSAPVTDLAEASGVPDPRIYDVLRDLENEGYIELYEQESLYARAFSLEEVIGDLQRQSEQFAEAAEEIERRWEQPAIEETSVSIVKQFETVLKNASASIRSADSQVQVALGTDHYESLRPALQTAVENGVTVSLSLYTGDEDIDSFLADENVEAVCTEIRHRELRSPFIVIVDRMETYFGPHEGSTNEYGVLVEDPTHTHVFHWFFLTNQWDIWEPYYTSSSEGPPTEYMDIRYCIRDVGPLLEEGATVHVRIEGTDTETEAERTVEGVVSDVLFSGSTGDEHSGSVASYGGKVSLVVETDEGSVEVGGWGATIEDVEAHRLTLVSVE
jgi:sugar-specific transcriptional regulator TrmB